MIIRHQDESDDNDDDEAAYSDLESGQAELKDIRPAASSEREDSTMSDDGRDNEASTKATEDPINEQGVVPKYDDHVIQTQYESARTTTVTESKPGSQTIVVGESPGRDLERDAEDATANASVADAGSKSQEARQTKQIDYPPYEEPEDFSAYDGEARLSNGDIL